MWKNGEKEKPYKIWLGPFNSKQCPKLQKLTNFAMEGNFMFYNNFNRAEWHLMLKGEEKNDCVTQIQDGN